MDVAHSRQTLTLMITLLWMGVVGPTVWATPRGGPPPVMDCWQTFNTSAGGVRGQAEDETHTCSWLGIPYAAPPVGNLRFAAPRPPAPWKEIRSTRRFAPRCMQVGSMELVNFDPSRQEDEDCLYLNVWRPRLKGQLPVMVWIHGGGYFGGTANTPLYHGDHLAEAANVMVVSMNYRLNVFGFLATEAMVAEDPHHSAGNFALLDQIQALTWVKENISAFGGDPNNITIAGESAGGWSICTLLASPLATGLFHKAIMESGGCVAATSLPRAYEVARRVEEDVGCARGDLDCLRGIPAQKLSHRAVNFELKGFDWMPRVDGYVLKDRPDRVLRSGEYNRVPLLAGSNRDEIGVAPALFVGGYLDPGFRYTHRLQRSFGEENALALSSAYPLSTWRTPASAYKRIFTEADLYCPTLDGARLSSHFEPATWFYRFDFDDFRYGKLSGSAHAMELPFVFGDLKDWPLRPLYGYRHRQKAAELVRQVQQYWGNFIHHSDPNGEGLVPWPRVGSPPTALVLDGEIRAESLPPAQVERCDLWSRLKDEDPSLIETLGFPQGRKYLHRQTAQ